VSLSARVLPQQHGLHSESYYSSHILVQKQQLFIHN
jgi:hypothetical protein